MLGPSLQGMTVRLKVPESTVDGGNVFKSLSDASSDVNYLSAELLRANELQEILKGVEHYVYD